MITTITKEQEALIPKFSQEYLAIGLSTEPINLEEMKKTINAWYAYIKQPEPSYLVFTSPAICSLFCRLLGSGQLRDQLNNQLDCQLRDQLNNQLDCQLRDQLNNQLNNQLNSQLRNQLGSQLGSQGDLNYWATNLAGPWISYFRCGEHWGVKYTSEAKTYLDQWDHIARHGFHWWPRVGLAVCSQRPTYISFNDDKRLHADGRKAVEFADGWGVYCFDGVRLPEHYGKTPSKDWKPEWFVKEANVEVKRLLAKQIGYEKLFKSLEAKKLDSWREYELFRIENADIEPMHILAMTCPSTGHRHFGRVPPDCMFAREAATLRNRGIDPETFIVEH